MAFACLQGSPRSLRTAKAEVSVIILMLVVVYNFSTAFPPPFPSPFCGSTVKPA